MNEQPAARQEANAPLYEAYLISERTMEILHGHSADPPAKFDGYCPGCARDTTFTLTTAMFSGKWADVMNRPAAMFDVALECARNPHQLYFNLRQTKLQLMKMGQFPSLADIANDETRSKYRAILKGANWAELYKAIGLAAHGEGIGSFVYLRRVLERLVHSRFEEFKAVEGWKEEDFASLHMDQKIGFLKGHLPTSLIENRRLYGIFSLGLHELDNDECLNFFDVGKRSIIVILQDDLKAREEREMREELQKAISNFKVS